MIRVLTAILAGAIACATAVGTALGVRMLLGAEFPDALQGSIVVGLPVGGALGFITFMNQVSKTWADPRMPPLRPDERLIRETSALRKGSAQSRWLVLTSQRLIEIVKLSLKAHEVIEASLNEIADPEPSKRGFRCVIRGDSVEFRGVADHDEWLKDLLSAKAEAPPLPPPPPLPPLTETSRSTTGQPPPPPPLADHS